MNYNKGDKVRVLSKSTGDTIKNTYHYNHAKEMGQDYLYVVGCSGEVTRNSHITRVYVLNYDGQSDNGDFYLESDIELYTEKLSPEELYKDVITE